MKTLLIGISMLASVTTLFSQSLFVSNFKIKTCEGSLTTLKDVLTPKTGTIIIFWEINNSKSISDLENLQDSWLEELKNYNIALIAICEDRQGSWPKVKPFVNGRSWAFDVYIDENGALKRSLGITTVPHTLLLDENENIKCSYPGYCLGDEIVICDKIRQCLDQNNNLSSLK